MLKKIRLFLNYMLARYGYKIIPEYEIVHKRFKYNEAVDEIYNFFKEVIFKNLPERSDRKYFLRRLYGTQLSEAMYIIYYLNLAIKHEGDVCEFGCANGATSALLANEIKQTKKNLFLYDSFKGLSRPSQDDKLINDMFNLESMASYRGTMRYSPKEVHKRLLKVNIDRKRINVIPGYIKDTIHNNLPDKICFAYIDFDLYKPTQTTLKEVGRRITRGGYIIVDDYGFFSSGVKKAVDEFLKENHTRFDFVLPKKFSGHFCILEKN